MPAVKNGRHFRLCGRILSSIVLFNGVHESYTSIALTNFTEGGTLHAGQL